MTARTNLERVCVVGAGVIGSLCAVHLAQVADVTVLVRRQEHADALREDGLEVSGKSNFTSPVAAFAKAKDVPDFDLGIVATKATQMDEAVSAFSGRFPGAVFMTIQNGLGAEELMTRYGDWPIVSSVTFMSGIKRGDSHIHYELDTATWIGPYQGTNTPLSTAEAVGELFVASGLKAEVLPDLRPAQWSKLIFNHAINSVAAVTDLAHVGLYAETSGTADLGHLVRGLMDEGKEVASSLGVQLFEDPWEMNLQAVSVGETDFDAYAHVPSMLADIRAGRPTEVEFITGAVVREASRAGVDVPLSSTMYRLVKARDHAAQQVKQ